MDSQAIYRRRWLILSVLIVGLLAIVIDNTVLNVALKTIAQPHGGLGASQSQLEWAINSYTLVFAGLLFTFGVIGDKFGRKRMLMIGLALFGIASLLSAYSRSPEQLIFARAAMGLGGAAVMPQTLSIISHVFEPAERPRAIGLWAMAVGLGIATGPVLGGLLVESSWRWIFLINLPVILAALTAGAVILPQSGAQRAGRRGGHRPGWRIDGVGTFLVLGSVGLVCTALTEAPGWPPARTWPVLAAGLVLATAFVAHIRRHPDPLVAPRLFSARAFSAGAAGLVTYYTGFAAMLLGTTLLLTAHWHSSVLHAAVSIAPGPITAGIVSPFI